MVLLCLIIYFSYFKCSYSYPGHIPLKWLEWDGSMYTRPKYPIYCDNINKPHAGINKLRLYCNKCKLYRPPRTGHCSKCNICVARMDHHCSFMQNCIGINNHRYFMQFLFWLSIGLLIWMYWFYYTINNIKYNIYLYYIGYFMNYFGYIPLLFCLFTLKGNIRSLLNNTCYLQLKFQFDNTGYMGYNVDPLNENEINYDTGSIYKNIISVFGTSYLRWFIPIDLRDMDIKKTMIKPGLHGSWELVPSINCCANKIKDKNIKEDSEENDLL